MDHLCAMHVMPLLAGHEAELATDAEKLLRDGVCTRIGCMMTLVPEGEPVADKAVVLAERYRNFLGYFKGDPGTVGILLQASIGHGWTPDEPCGFQKLVYADGSEHYQMCPLDPEFLAYLQQQLSTLSQLNPAFFMVDDDFRLQTYRTGCFCLLHLAEFARRTGKTYSREELVRAVVSNPAVAGEFDAMQLDSLLGAARVIRRSIGDAPCSLCTCVGDVRHANEIIKVLAGDGERIVRINNARYLKADMRTFPRRMYEGAAQIAGLEPRTLVLAETDTCPHNRWSTAAALMHAHYTGSILEGCAGGKHWLTRLDAWEPEAGRAYREIFARYAGFYAELFHALQGAVAAPGPVCAFPTEAVFRNPVTDADRIGAKVCWGDFLSLMGLPAMFVKMPSGPVLLGGEEVSWFSDAELETFAAQGMILDGEAAAEFTRRGLSALTGVTAAPWRGERISGERAGELAMTAAPENYRLTPLFDQVAVRASFIHRKPGAEEPQVLAPSLTHFCNEKGGRVAVFGGKLPTLEGFAPFSLLNLSRKSLLIETMEYVTGNPISYIPGDLEVYFKDYLLKSGDRLMAFFNLSFDPIEALPLTLPIVPRSLERLRPDGAWEPLDYREGHLIMPLNPAFPEIVKMKA